jgi:hypothetical protein
MKYLHPTFSLFISDQDLIVVCSEPKRCITTNMCICLFLNISWMQEDFSLHGSHSAVQDVDICFQRQSEKFSTLLIPTTCCLVIVECV